MAKPIWSQGGGLKSFQSASLLPDPKLAFSKNLVMNFLLELLTWVQSLAPPSPGCVTWDKLPHHSVPNFLHL